MPTHETGGDHVDGAPEVKTRDTRRGRWLLTAVIALAVAAGAIVAIISTRRGEPEQYSLRAAVQRLDTSVGDFEFEAEIRVPSVELQATIKGFTDRANARMRINMELPSTYLEGYPITFVVDSAISVVYMDGALMFGLNLGRGLYTTWVRCDIREMGQRFLLPGAMIQDQLELVRGFDLDGVEDLGKDEADGVEVKHYRVTMVVGELMDKVPSLRDTWSSFQLDPTDDIRIDVYIDAQNTPRRLVYVLGSGSATAEYDIVLRSVAQSKTIPSPEPAHVVDIADVPNA